MILLRTYLVAFVLFISMGVSAQNIDLFSENNYSNNPDIITGTFKSTRIINGQSIENVGPGILDFRILHRFGSGNILRKGTRFNAASFHAQGR